MHMHIEYRNRRYEYYQCISIVFRETVIVVVVYICIYKTMNRGIIDYKVSIINQVLVKKIKTSKVYVVANKLIRY